MDTNELFDALKRELSAGGRQDLVSQALDSGIALDEIRDMLDYIDLVQSVHAPASRPATPPSLWQSLIHACRFQINHR